MEEFVSCDVAKEFLMVLSYCESTFIDSIPDYVLKQLNDLAADSSKDFYIDMNKSLEEQNLSSECIDLLGKMYFTYVIDSDAKKEILSELISNVDNF